MYIYAVCGCINYCLRLFTYLFYWHYLEGYRLF